MIKRKRKIKVPAAEFGLEETSKLLLGLATLGALGTAAATNGLHESIGSSMLSSLSSGLSMASTGALLGSIIPGLGTAAGAIIGGTAGILTSGLSGGRDAEMTSFTDYDEGELAGFLRPGKRKAQKRERDRLKMNAYGNRAAVTGTEYLRDRYDEDNYGINGNTFANGGTTASLAYVDDGELISTPDGSISKVPERGNPTDSNLVSLPEGSKILSDSLKVPGTNKTFALVGEEMMATKKSKFNDKYALNAAKLNEMNNKSIHDLLFEILEAVKAKKGIKRKYKNAVVAAETGDLIYDDNRFKVRKDGTIIFTSKRGDNLDAPISYNGNLYTLGKKLTIGNAGSLYILKPITSTTTVDNSVYTGNSNNVYGDPFTMVNFSPTNSSVNTSTNYVNTPINTTANKTIATPTTRSAISTTSSTGSRRNSYGLTPYSNYTQVGMDYYGTDAAADYMTRREWTLHNQNDPRVKQLLADINAGKYGNIGGNQLTWNDYVRLSMDGKIGPVHNAIMALQIPDDAIRIGANGLVQLSPKDWIGEDSPYKPNPDGWRKTWTSDDLPLPGTTPAPATVNNNNNDNKGDKTPFDWTGLLSTVSGLTPIISKLLERPEYQDPNYNPYADTVARTMRRRRYDINPAIRDIERNRVISNYDASLMNTNTGANLAFRLLNAANTSRAIADLRSQESNVNNAYLGEYALMLNNLGQQWAAETTRVDDANMANRAQARSINRTGLSELSQWMQNRELMRNQRNADEAMLELYRPLLDNFTSDVVNRFNRYIRRR